MPDEPLGPRKENGKEKEPAGPDRPDILLAMLKSALDAVQEGIIITDTAGRILFYNRALEKMEGLAGSEVVGRHLTEVYRVSPEKSEHIRAVRTGKPVQELAKQYFTGDGREISLVAATYPVFENGRVVGAFSICRDITRLKDLLSESIRLKKDLQTESGSKNPKQNGTRYTFSDLVYTSPVMENLVRQAEKVARADCSVMVYGETGTGKEVFAQSIHNASPRKEQPFLGINCAAIPDTLLEGLLFGTVRGAFTGAVDSAGLLEQAGRGTLFLDEINSMSPPLQAKLLRVLQERTFRRVGGQKEIPLNCRVVTSINAEPWECIQKGTLREDLYYRLAVFTLFIPPLRDRPEDIEALITHFVGRYSKIYGQGRTELDPELKLAFLAYPWPGNVRELEHIIESSLAMLDPGETKITFGHLPSFVRPKFSTRRQRPDNGSGGAGGSLRQLMEDAQRRVIREALENHRGNITRAAQSLGILRQNLQYRMRKLGIKAGSAPPAPGK